MKLFKKEVSEEVSVLELIEKVHNEFTSVEDKLYDEAMSILSYNADANAEKVARLKKLGFTVSKEVVEAEVAQQKKKMSMEIVQLIKHYRDRYPLFKFITEDQVIAICEKYGLIYAKADRFTGFIPDDKLRIMESFKANPEDMVYIYYGSGDYWNSHTEVLTFEEMTKRRIKKAVADTRFLMIAPKTDFKINADEEIRNHTIVKKPVPDPICLFPVKGGYLNVVAWGEEASDPAVVNEINN